MQPKEHIDVLDPALPITPQVTRHLRERIIRNDLTAGNRISETEIARAYEVSRQPVREAFIKLAEQGLLAVLPQRGTVVTRINWTDVLDARFLREAIEADFVTILAARPEPALIIDLREQIAAQRAVDPQDYQRFNALDETFHRTLAEAAGKAGAWRLLEGLKAQMDRVRFLALAQFPMNRLIDQHEAVVEGIAGGDHDTAVRAIRLHLREILSDLPAIQAANPDAFALPEGGIPDPLNVPLPGTPSEGHKT